MSATETRSVIGIGLYDISEASRIIRVPRKKLVHWSYGYKTKQGKFSDPVFTRDIDGDGEKILSFLDLIELHLVSMFRSVGVSMPTIRAAAATASKMFNTEHPFAVKRFDTDGDTIFATLQSRRVEDVSAAHLVADLARAQMVMEHIASAFFMNLDYDDDLPLRLWPRGKEAGIVLDPTRQYGSPIDDETGVPTAVLYQMARGGESIENIADWYDVSVNSVVEAIRFESFLGSA